MTFSEAAMIMMSGSKVIQPIAITQYGDYEIKAPKGVDGYNPIHVNLKDRYQAGYTDGWMKCFLNIKTITITKNGTYNAKSENLEGYNPVVVDVPDRYDEGYADGEAAVKAKIQSKTITKNGTYYASDDGLYGFDPVNVNVPDNYDDGYLDGFESAMAYTSGEPDLSKTFYIYIGVQTLESTGEQYVQLNIFNSSDTSNVAKQMSWGYGADTSFDKTITGIAWSDDKAGTITVYATSYNKAHTEKYTNAPHVFDRLTYDYGITKSNHSIGNTNLE